MVTRYRVFVSGPDGVDFEVGGTGCYNLSDIQDYCSYIGGYYTEEDYPEPPEDDPYYFLFERFKNAQEWLK